MRIDNEAWCTMYDPDFRKDNYLYHFTDLDKAIKILYNNTLKFSKINTTNDPLEAKPKIMIKGADKKYNIQSIINYFQSVNKNMQLLCFTRDLSISISAYNTKMFYTDYSGRGFALPRMWAQYAENNTGVCLVFDKKKIEKLIDKYTVGALVRHGVVKYISQFEMYEFQLDEIESFLETIKRYSDMQQNLYNMDFFRANKKFVEYNYFRKLNDWEGENEYRFLAFGDNDYLIDNISDSLTGIIVGERILSHNMEIIKYFCDEVCEVKRISFTCNGCTLENI